MQTPTDYRYPGERAIRRFILRDGVITLEDLAEALGRLHTGKRLGTLLVEAGCLDAEALAHGVLTQVREMSPEISALPGSDSSTARLSPSAAPPSTSSSPSSSAT